MRAHFHFTTAFSERLCLRANHSFDAACWWASLLIVFDLATDSSCRRKVCFVCFSPVSIEMAPCSLADASRQCDFDDHWDRSYSSCSRSCSDLHLDLDCSCYLDRSWPSLGMGSARDRKMEDQAVAFHTASFGPVCVESNLDGLCSRGSGGRRKPLILAP